MWSEKNIFLVKEYFQNNILFVIVDYFILPPKQNFVNHGQSHSFFMFGLVFEQNAY